MDKCCRLCLVKLLKSDGEIYFLLDSSICQKFKEITDMEVKFFNVIKYKMFPLDVF